MGYLDIVHAQKEIILYLDKIAEKDAVIAADFPVYHGLIDKRAGYSSREYNVMGEGNEKEARADYLIFSSPGNFDSSKSATNNYTLLKKVKRPLATMYLYKKTEKDI